MAQEMDQDQRRAYLIDKLLAERTDMESATVPEDPFEQETFLRALMNLREPELPADEVLQVQDAYLKESLAQAGIIEFENLRKMKPHIRLWQGDLTLLRCDAIINPANPDLLGCWTPGHNCIDNAIHSFAGIQMRWRCQEISGGDRQPTCQAFITPGYNLPARNVIHTVIPFNMPSIGALKDKLTECYVNCYKLAKAQGCKTIAFPSLAQARMSKDNQVIARAAIRAIRDCQKEANPVDVAFVVLPDNEFSIYQSMLS